MRILDYKEAYRKTISKLKYADSLKYSLVYIDNDKIPELVCENSGGGGGILIYTYKSGKAKCLTNNYISEEFKHLGIDLPFWRYSAGAHGFEHYYYIPYKNKLYSRICHSRQISYTARSEEYVDIFFEIKKGRFRKIESIKNNMIVTEGDTEKNKILYQIRKGYKLLIGNYSKKEILKKRIKDSVKSLHRILKTWMLYAEGYYVPVNGELSVR